MKMVKKLLLGLVAVATVISLTGCVPNDDDNNAIKKGIGKYYINYTYEKPADATIETDHYRAYKSTGLKHAGALVKLTFKKGEAEPGSSKLGVIFGLKEDKKAKTRDFHIIALSKSGQWYVSTMTDIADIHAYNFGASTTAADGEPKEKEWVKINASTLAMPAADADGNVSVYIWYQAVPAGNYEWAILDMTDEQADAWNQLTKAEKQVGTIPTATKKLASGTIKNAFTPLTAEEKEAFKEPQYPISVYARVSGDTTLNGEWKLGKYYLEAEEEE